MTSPCFAASVPLRKRDEVNPQQCTEGTRHTPAENERKTNSCYHHPREQESARIPPLTGSQMQQRHDSRESSQTTSLSFNNTTVWSCCPAGSVHGLHTHTRPTVLFSPADLMCAADPVLHSKITPAAVPADEARDPTATSARAAPALLRALSRRRCP